MIWRRVACLALCLLVVGCGSSNNLTGNWTYNSTSNLAGGASNSGTLTLAQSVNSLTGTLNATNGNTYLLTAGTVAGNQINLPLTITCSNGTGTLALMGTISSSTSLTGTYSENDVCGVDSGSWTGGKVQ